MQEASGRIMVSLYDYCMQKDDVSLLEQWDGAKNGTLTASDVSSGSSRKVWWRCEKGHEWEADVKSRTFLSTGCPYCRHKKVAAGYNDLATVRPDVAAEWNGERNAPLTAADVSVASSRRVWWRCEKGHEYFSMIRSRTSRNSGCPYCTSKLLLKGFNDLETLFPLIARQWHPTLNGSVKPGDIFPATNVKYWWICEEGHVWKAAPSARTLKGRGRGCPVCGRNYSRSTLYRPELNEPPKGVQI